MTIPRQEAVIGSGAVVVEIFVIGLISPLVWSVPTSGVFFWIFPVAWFGCNFVILFRLLAGKAEDPNVDLIQRTLPWSSLLLQVSLIGAILNGATFLEGRIGFLPEIAYFGTLSIFTILLFTVLDQLILGKYAQTWYEIIYRETEDELVGRRLRQIADFGKEQIEAAMSGERGSQSPMRAIVLALGLFMLLMIIGLPVLFFFSEWFGGATAAILVLISLLLIRDAARYIYINYGAAQSFSDVKWPLRWEFFTLVGRGLLIAGVLGLL